METQLMVIALLWSLSVVTCEVIQLSCNAIKELLDGHNDRRMLLLKGKVAGQPTAASMKFMVWDEELANKAKNWASGNEFKHNPNKQIKSRRFTTGENLYWFSTTDRNYKFNYDMALAAWWDEHKDFTFQKLNRNLFGQRKKVGHYTQMAWADTINLGCGLSVEQRGKWKNFYLVCNYGPAGNYLGDTPYKKGTSEGQMICESSRCPQPYGESCYFKPKPFY